MKKTRFYISVFDSETHGQVAKQVEGYFEYVAGLPLGFHKSGGKIPVWTCTELSTGCKIAEGRTRADALENARPLFDKVCETIIRDDMRRLRDMIETAYKAGAA